MSERQDPGDAALVVIGRNEGERLVRCLASARGRIAPIVYVDSGSTDDSVAAARTAGAEVVELDTSTPFSAARARNEGWRRVRDLSPGVSFVQFVDGDCEVAPGWLEAAAAHLTERPEVAVVFGRRRERDPEASIYNRLCDLEWDTPIGEAESCGGDAMMRLSALVAVDGFDPQVVAGEEPEMSLRLRRLGLKLHRIASEMTLHDASMTRFSQWWRRAERAGHAYAQVAAMHGGGPERVGVRSSLSIWAWAAGLPLATIAAAWLTKGLGLLLLLAYPLLLVRIARSERRRGRPARLAWAYAFFCVLAKWPQLLGQLRFMGRRLLGRQAQIIEYKGAVDSRGGKAR